MRTVFPQISKIDLYVGGELLSPVDDKRLIGKCHFPERVVSLGLFHFFKLMAITNYAKYRKFYLPLLKRKFRNRSAHLIQYVLFAIFPFSNDMDVVL